MYWIETRPSLVLGIKAFKVRIQKRFSKQDKMTGILIKLLIISRSTIRILSKMSSYQDF